MADRSRYYDLPSIPGARENAEAWQQYLLRVRKVPAHHVFTFLDKQATKEVIRTGIRDAARAVKPGGTLWFIFIGHGAPDRGGQDGLLVGADSLQNVGSIQARGLPQRKVLELLEAGQQKETVAIFDACFSGKTGDGSADLVKGLQATVPVRKVDVPEPRTTILAASDSFAGPLPGVGRPAFSYLLLGALRGWADEGDKTVTLEQAFSFTRTTMQAVLKTSDRLPSMRGQRPSLAVPAKAPRPDIDALVAGRCPGGSTWSGTSCVSVCASGQVWDGIRCGQPVISCPAGSVWDGRVCKSVCPAGTVWRGNTCAAVTVACPGDTKWDGEACVAQRVALARPPDEPTTEPDTEAHTAEATVIEEPEQQSIPLAAEAAPEENSISPMMLWGGGAMVLAVGTGVGAVLLHAAASARHEAAIDPTKTQAAASAALFERNVFGTGAAVSLATTGLLAATGATLIWLSLSGD